MFSSKYVLRVPIQKHLTTILIQWKENRHVLYMTYKNLTYPFRNVYESAEARIRNKQNVYRGKTKHFQDDALGAMGEWSVGWVASTHIHTANFTPTGPAPLPAIVHPMTYTIRQCSCEHRKFAFPQNCYTLSIRERPPKVHYSPPRGTRGVETQGVGRFFV